MTTAGTQQRGGADVIEYAFGPSANLYGDVLSVPHDAEQPQIQSAFFDRRYELYEILSKEENALTPTERHFAERRMDAIVAAYRILSNPQTRAEYDEVLILSASALGEDKQAKGGKGSKGTSSSSARPSESSHSTPPGKRGRSRSLLRKALSASPLSRSKSASTDQAAGSSTPTGSTTDHHGRRRRASSAGLDDGEIRLQQQLLQQSNAQIPTQQLKGGGTNRNRRLSAHLHAHSQPSTPSASTARPNDDQTISTLGMRGAITPTRPTPTRPIGILKNQGSDETDRTRPVESDNDEDGELYDYHQAYTNDAEGDDDIPASPVHHPRRHRRPSRSSAKHRSRSSRRKYESETEGEEDTTVAGDDDDDDESSAIPGRHRKTSSSARSRKYDDIETLGCSALAPMDFLLRPGRVFRAVKEEVTGAAVDTTSAFDQVCNVFTLRGSEINAVVGEIDGAKRELSPDGKSKSKKKEGGKNKKAGSSLKKSTTCTAAKSSRSGIDTKSGKSKGRGSSSRR
mmetsp:Transcript_9106/g.25633  ORF Transcript_9106/g.25633 Transcript_9106/m.25633 type:complete len:513 (+) Transcript_9106:153-1691(+)